jgi:hypothetical protein
VLISVTYNFALQQNFNVFAALRPGVEKKLKKA